jgi:hypothetical protein
MNNHNHNTTICRRLLTTISHDHADTTNRNKRRHLQYQQCNDGQNLQKTSYPTRTNRFLIVGEEATTIAMKWLLKVQK